MTPEDIQLTIKGLTDREGPSKDPERDVYPEARTLRALGVDVPESFGPMRPVAVPRPKMLEILRARLTQIAPELVAPYLVTESAPVVPNPVQLDQPIVDDDALNFDTFIAEEPASKESTNNDL
jgi:hypothetical protein